MVLLFGVGWLQDEMFRWSRTGWERNEMEFPRITNQDDCRVLDKLYIMNTITVSSGPHLTARRYPPPAEPLSLILQA